MPALAKVQTKTAESVYHIAVTLDRMTCVSHELGFWGFPVVIEVLRRTGWYQLQ
jgi:hypothetical protein